MTAPLTISIRLVPRAQAPPRCSPRPRSSTGAWRRRCAATSSSGASPMRIDSSATCMATACPPPRWRPCSTSSTRRARAGRGGASTAAVSGSCAVAARAGKGHRARQRQCAVLCQSAARRGSQERRPAADIQRGSGANSRSGPRGARCRPARRRPKPCCRWPRVSAPLRIWPALNQRLAQLKQAAAGPPEVSEATLTKFKAIELDYPDRGAAQGHRRLGQSLLRGHRGWQGHRV